MDLEEQRQREAETERQIAADDHTWHDEDAAADGRKFDYKATQPAPQQRREDHERQ